MGGMKGQKKRRWSDDEKRSICEQTLTPGISVAQVARRYSMNANLIFTWLRDAREYSTALAHLFHEHVASHSMTCGHPREVICEAIYS